MMVLVESFRELEKRDASDAPKATMTLYEATRRLHVASGRYCAVYASCVIASNGEPRFEYDAYVDGHGRFATRVSSKPITRIEDLIAWCEAFFLSPDSLQPAPATDLALE